MMLNAVPEPVREELVSSRRMSVFSIITHLYVTYCPGGVSEKHNLLKSLEEPSEVGSLTDAPPALRKWLRWRQRATEIGATMPDPTLLVRGLLKMTRKVLESNRELQFRVSLARHGLGVHTVPTIDNVTKFAMHVLSECEQLAQMEKKPSTSVPKAEPKIKSLELEKDERSKGMGKGKDRSGEEERGEKARGKCRFFLTVEGCRKGRVCRYSHSESLREGWKEKMLHMWLGRALGPRLSKKGHRRRIDPKAEGVKDGRRSISEHREARRRWRNRG